MHFDAEESKRVNALMDRISEQYFRNLTPKRLENLTRAVAMRTEDYQRGQLSKQIKAGIGLDLHLADRGLLKQIDNFVAENVSLIKSIPNQYFDEIEKTVTRGIANGQRWETMAKDIAKRAEGSGSRARLIARDQTGKFYGRLNETRQTELGIDAYIWRTSNDARVRDEHVEREGKRFLWSDPPSDGHPGEPINCRCFSEPDLSALLGS